MRVVLLLSNQLSSAFSFLVSCSKLLYINLVLSHSMVAVWNFSYCRAFYFDPAYPYVGSFPCDFFWSILEYKILMFFESTGV
jgi:hypothetical protein